MLKRNGQSGGSTARVVSREEAAYTAAMEAIRPEFEELTRLGRQLDGFRQHANGPFGTGAIIVSDGAEWQSQVQLLKLPASEVFLCRQTGASGFAIIQHFQTESPYAKTHGNAEILLRGEDANQLVGDYAAEVRHTLRFMASNAVAKAQRVAWKQFPAHHPDRVVRAISERCAQVVSQREVVRQPIHRGQGLGV